MECDPYVDLASNWPDVRIRIRADLGPDAGRTIWGGPADPEIHLAHDLNRLQRRCTLAHEIRHLERGPSMAGTPQDEQAVIAATARWLIPDVDELAHELLKYDVTAAAQHMDVLESIIWDRLDTLGKYELAHFTTAMRSPVRLVG